jgi:hypothetical protein
VAASQGLVTSRRSVKVRTEFITARPSLEGDSTVRRLLPLDHPVATSGFVSASTQTPSETDDETTAVAAGPPHYASAARAIQASETPVAPVPGSADPVERTASPVVFATVARIEGPDATSAPATSLPDRAADLRKQEEIVRRVLLDYTRAFERLDVKAAKAIWPSLDDRALQRAFQQLDGQQVHFASCGVSVTERDANARCRGEATYRPKVGSRVLRLTAREWTFNLARDNDRWQIVNATLQ